jgi:oligoribonuclease NrnB/cAMP/cGMP phosphodiesterase (DHH superfamily)
VIYLCWSFILGGFLRVYHLSHIDLDGYGCQYLTTKQFDFIKCYNANYGTEVGARIEEIISDIKSCESNDEKLILITDLNLTTKECRVLEREANSVGAKITLLDHHLTGLSASEHFEWYYLDDSRCATKITYDWLIENFGFDTKKEYSKIVDAINAIDIWVDESPYFAYGKVLLGMISGAREINRILFPDEDRRYRFWLIDSAKNILNSHNLDDAPIILDDALHANKKAFFIGQKNDTKDNLVADFMTKLLSKNRDNLTIKYENAKGLLGYNIGSASLIGNAFLVANPDYDFYMDVNSRGNFSLRSNDKIDVSKMAEVIGAGGGHPNASGGKIEGYKDSFIYGKVKDFIQKYIDEKVKLRS